MLELGDYAQFVEQRHQVYLRRQARDPDPYAGLNPVFRTTKFTNVFRILDPGTQFAIRLIQDGGYWEDKVARAVLYRLTNRPEPWEEFRFCEGRWPILSDFLGGEIERVWRPFQEAGNGLFGSAYRLHVGTENKGLDKLTWLTKVCAPTIELAAIELSTRIGEPQRMFETLTTLPRVAGFMAMQILTDLSYLLPMNDENAFVEPGPGAIRGAQALGLEPREAIQTAWELFDARGDVALAARTPSLMDIQNTFCEFGKFARYAAGDKARSYAPGREPLPDPWLPPAWFLP